MIRNYLKIALRNLVKNKVYSFVNIGGLALGLAVTLLIALYVVHEYSYDRFHEKADRIVKVELSTKEGESVFAVPKMSYRFGEALQRATPEVENFARIQTNNYATKPISSDAAHKFDESGFGFTDNRFFQVFSFKFIKGNAQTALTRPETIVLTERMAKKYFGDTDPIGKILTYDQKYLFEVVAVIADPPVNSTVQFNFLAQLDTQRAIDRASYLTFMDEKTTNATLESVGASGGFDTYLLLKNKTMAAAVARKIPTILSEFFNSKDIYVLYPLIDYHFAASLPKYQQTIDIFGIIAGLILALALINYVNLTTARATTRAREVAIRKVAGSDKKALVWQFYLESLLYVSLAFGLAFVLFNVLKPIFYETLQLQIDSSFTSSSYFLGAAVALFVISVLLSGGYPAWMLAGFSPAQILKSKASAKNSLLRQSLTVFQFTIAMVLIVGSILIKNQLDLFLSQNMGFERQRVIGIRLDEEAGAKQNCESLKNNLSQIAGVESVTGSSFPIYGNYMNGWRLSRLKDKRTVDVNSFPVDQEFIKTMRVEWAIPPLKSVDFSVPDKIIINEAAAKVLGINAKNYQQPLGLGDGNIKQLVGVVKDFPYQSLTQKIRPMAFSVSKASRFHEYLYVKLNKKADIEVKLSEIKGVYNQYKIEKPFDYYFLDEAYQKLYSQEINTGKLIFAFTGFAILIACLGLFGLATFTTESRTKEIGIRKVLGASVAGITGLLSKDFLKLVLVAIVIGSPVAYYLMDKWLADFAYRIDISAWVFVAAGALAIGVALLTVGFQAIKAALMNPVQSLKTE
ncbi:MAG: ABC transporter permease [Cytophagales bacterium]|nr:MAG: ABC transporter permease [Cytophagales bacterium]